jgi:hypothetical protein
MILSFFMLSMGTLAMSSANADAQQTVVGTGNYLTDVKAVQQAVDQGGTIILKGRFFFGGNGSVTIKKDVQIIGEKEKDVMAKITGGQEVFKTIIPDPYNPDVPGPKVAIQNIHFEWALRSAIDISYSSGATINGNKFSFRIYPYSIFGKPGYFIHGIACGTFDVFSPLQHKRYSPGAFTGNLVIKDNELDLRNSRPEETLGIGIMISWTTGVTADISGNNISNCGRESILTMDNFKDKDGKGGFVISGNHIVANSKGIDAPDDLRPSGITLGAVDLRNLKMDEYVKYRVENNLIKAQGEKARGIVVLVNDAIVQNNHVTLGEPAFLGIGVLGSNCQVLKNKIEGKGMYGVSIRNVKDRYKDLIGCNNKLEANDFSKLNSTDGDVLISKGADGNVVIGESGTFNDQGADNQIKGLKKVSQ